MTGKAPKRIRDINHPLKKAKNKPEKHIPKESKIYPTFSPRAF